MFKTIGIFAAALFLSIVFQGANAAQAGVISTAVKAIPGLATEQGLGQILPETEAGSEQAALQEGLESGAAAAATVGAATITAYASGAGALTGYAGMASAVSTLGLGSLTTMGATLLGSSATGAAATAVCTAALGGPVAAAGAVIVGLGAASYGLYKGASALTSWLGF